MMATILRSTVATALAVGAVTPVLAETAIDLDEITVEGEGEEANANEADSGISRLGGELKSIPKTVTVVNQEMLDQQQVTTLEQALRNVPGITLSTGEGNGGLNGDQFRIRGISSGGDVYQDGLKDFGIYVRDTFNTDSVQVFKGPTGAATGTGNTAGVINSTTKRAHLGDANEVSAAISSGTTVRSTLDMNKQLSETSAIRLNLMAQEGEVAGRDNVAADRQGLAVDYAAGLGTDFEWHLGLVHQANQGTPDYGQPMAVGADGIARPLLEYGIPNYDSSVSYVREMDYDDSTNTSVSAALEYTLGSGAVIRSETRLTKFDRETVTSNTPACSATCLTDLLAGTDVIGTRGAGGGVSYALDGYGIQNVTTGNFEFTTGGLRHEAQIGVDVNKQDLTRYAATFTPARVNTVSLLNPVYAQTGSVNFDTKAWNTSALNAALFASDRVWFNEQFSVSAAIRADYFKNEMLYGTATETTESSDTVASPSLAFFYEPTENTTLYASASRSYRPQATDSTTLTAVAAAGVTNARYYEPEQSDAIELGAKMNLLDGRLGLTGALFQITKDNSYVEDESGVVGSLEAGRRLEQRGFELGVSGQATEDLTISVAYAYLDGELKAPLNSTGYLYEGMTPAGVSKHNATIWGDYKLTDKLSLGGGLRYASEYYANDANTAVIPETFAADAQVAYETEDWKAAFNVYNISDHQNYSSSFNASRAVPESGRSFGLSLSRKF